MQEIIKKVLKNSKQFYEDFIKKPAYTSTPDGIRKQYLIIKFLDKRKKMIKYANFYTQLRNKFSFFHIYKKNEIFK